VAVDAARADTGSDADKNFTYLLTLGIAYSAGVVDDYIAATPVGAMELESWELNGAGKAQVEVGKTIKALNEWGYETFGY
jgi:hypothetical protein